MFIQSICTIPRCELPVFVMPLGLIWNRGVIHVLIKKPKAKPASFEVYGDGTQTKPYIWIDDLVNGVMTLLEKTDVQYNAYLVGVDSNVTVDQIAQIVTDELGEHISTHYGGRCTGWKEI